MMSCKEVSLLISKASDTRLGWRERLGIRLHLLICKGCAQFRTQLQFLRVAARTLADRVDDTGRPGLSASARQRIATALHKHS